MFFSKVFLFVSLCGCFLLSLSFVCAAACEKSPPVSSSRFASLKSAEVNVRTGPGSHYPIQWVFVRQNLPVQVLAEFDNWRKIADFENIQGWVHQSLISNKRTVRVMKDKEVLKNTPGSEGKDIAYLEKGVIASLLKTEKTWCQIHIEGVTKGWILCNALWGVQQEEEKLVKIP